MRGSTIATFVQESPLDKAVMVVTDYYTQVKIR